ncbi:MAG TPA: Fis family transcriptional regulator [Syntrophobacteraceae bacterium]|nr:Fis family transcriptional regulator [Syntrophobacteraceae bacterium]
MGCFDAKANETMERVLFVEDDDALRLTQSLYLQREGLEVVSVRDRTQAREELARQTFHVVVTDLRLGKESGVDVLKDVRDLHPSAEVLVITGYGSVDSAVAVMKEGAYDYLTKPVDPETLVHLIHKALEHQKLRREVNILRSQFATEAGLDRIVAVSPPMKDILGSIDSIASCDSTVLIEGESGTGKELMAKLIHQRSLRGNGPFIGINCGAMSENLLESELFGHKRGSFTGAHKDQKGLFEAADKGTLFLDEVAELSASFQVKLLRALQDHRIRRIGDTREIKVDVRIIAASNKDIAQLVREGHFRQDLFFRIKVIPIFLPPLRKRREDIIPLAESCLERLGNRMGRRKPVLTETAKGRLLDYDWPGNVRELENTLERSLIFKKDNRVDSGDLMLEGCFGPSREPSGDATPQLIPLDEVERRHVLLVLEHCGRNRAQAAKILGIGYNTLWRKLKKYGLS